MATLRVIEEFLNTVDERTFRRHGENHVPGERLTSPQALEEWLRAQGLAAADTRLRATDLDAAVELRTALRRALGADAGATAALRNYPLHLALDTSGALLVTARSGRPWLDAITEEVARSTARGDWTRLKLCAAPDCRWAFYDASRSGRGRWCDMEICGNRHKTRAYRERRQHPAADRTP
ncbi:CGNR zinc finger domain-containing protein [Streptomyces sp. NPDC047002]|uniref:CGNR zinc finger domain-containing protein n=1 Tax=Streptomyces sp. NPDC047002 TaxID=3155475 RepID=UPI003454CA94